jgi:hypothetical protein
MGEHRIVRDDYAKFVLRVGGVHARPGPPMDRGTKRSVVGSHGTLEGGLAFRHVDQDRLARLCFNVAPQPNALIISPRLQMNFIQGKRRRSPEAISRCRQLRAHVES